MTNARLPVCLGALHGRQTVRDWAVRGFQALIEAALPTRSTGHARFLGSVEEVSGLTRRLGSLWHRLRVPLLGVTGESAQYVQALERKLQGRLDSSMRKLPLMDGLPLPRLHILGLAALRQSELSLMPRALDGETAAQLMTRLEGEGRSYWGPGLPDVDTWHRRGTPLPWEAANLARACLRVLHDQFPGPQLSELDAAALALLGAVQRQVAMTTRCSACFRWCEPGTDTCYEHRPINLLDTHLNGEKILRTRCARELAQKLYGAESTRETVSYERCIGSLYWLNRTLWPMPLEHEEEVVDMLMPLVESLPGVLDVLHTTARRLSRETLLVRLQQHIDPLEVRLGAWPHIVELANAWHHYEAWQRLPRLGGPSLATKEKVRRAIQAGTLSGAGRNEVARQIGVSPTLLSHWPCRVDGVLGELLVTAVKLRGPRTA